PAPLLPSSPTALPLGFQTRRPADRLHFFLDRPFSAGGTSAGRRTGLIIGFRLGGDLYPGTAAAPTATPGTGRRRLGLLGRVRGGSGRCLPRAAFLGLVGRRLRVVRGVAGISGLAVVPAAGPVAPPPPPAAGGALLHRQFDLRAEILGLVQLLPRVLRAVRLYRLHDRRLEDHHGRLEGDGGYRARVSRTRVLGRGRESVARGRGLRGALPAAPFRSWGRVLAGRLGIVGGRCPAPGTGARGTGRGLTTPPFRLLLCRVLGG